MMTTTTTSHQLLLLFHSTACCNSSSKHRRIIHCAPTELWSLSSMNNDDDDDNLIMISMTLGWLLLELSLKNWEPEKGLASSFSLSQHGKRASSCRVPCVRSWVNVVVPPHPPPPPLVFKKGIIIIGSRVSFFSFFFPQMLWCNQPSRWPCNQIWLNYQNI